MEEQEQVVNPEAPTTSEPEAVNQEVASPEKETQQVETPVADAGQKSVSNDLDEFGVPWKNRAKEWERKAEKEREEKEKYLKSQQAQQPQKYTIDQLEAFALNEDTPPEHKQWALREAEKLRQEKIEEVVEKRLKLQEQLTRGEQIRQQTVSTVISQNPDMVLKDPAGNFAGWNNNSPLVQRVGQYMNDPDLAKRPDALAVAVKLAKGDLYDSQRPKVNQTIEKANTELRNLQKKTLVEGSGNQDIPQLSPYDAALQKLSKTGSKEDAKFAMKEYFKAKGVISE